MARFTTWVTEEVTRKVWFDANDKEHARKLIQDVWEGELELEDLCNSQLKIKSSDVFFTEIEEVD